MLSLSQTIKDLYAKLKPKADKSYVDKKISDLVNGAPEQLDTLRELSNALNNDKDYATNVNNVLTKKLDKTGGTITGDLTVNGKINGTSSKANSVPWAGITDKPGNFIIVDSWDANSGVLKIKTV